MKCSRLGCRGNAASQLHALPQFLCSHAGRAAHHPPHLFPLHPIAAALQTVMVSEDRLAPVALLHPTAFHVEPKQAAQQEQQGQQPEQEQGERQQQEAAGEGPGAAVIEVRCWGKQPNHQRLRPAWDGQRAATRISRACPLALPVSPLLLRVAADGPLCCHCIPQVPIDYEPAPSVTAALSPSLPPPASTANATAEAAVPGSSAGFPVRLSCTEGREYVTLAAEVPRLLPVFDGSPAGSAAATAGALAAALGALGGALPALGLSWRSALFVHLYVPSMAHFAAANEAYARFFPPINPPSRATVEIGPNPELALVVEVLLARWARLRCGGEGVWFEWAGRWGLGQPVRAGVLLPAVLRSAAAPCILKASFIMQCISGSLRQAATQGA